LEVTYTPVQVTCAGQIIKYIKEHNAYEVFVHKTPNDSLLSNIYAKATYQPGLSDNYKVGDYVTLSMMFNFENGSKNKFVGPINSGTSHILGVYDERSILNEKVENPQLSHSDTITFVNKYNGAGFGVDEDGTVRSASGSNYSLIKAFGYGTSQDSYMTLAQNHIKTIAANGPYYLSKEYFGLFSGSSLEDQLQRTNDEDFPITFRRFVTQSMDIKNWVSTCEGTFAPWFGPNNNFDYVQKAKEVLFTKIINHDKLRVTIEAGDPKQPLNLRVDDVIKSEKEVTSGKYGVVTGSFGNRFSLIIDEKGSLDIRASGKGKSITQNNEHGFHLSVDIDGNLTVKSKGKISFTHGDSDIDNNSIVLDPDKGVDIKANKGFRVNGKELVTKNFLDWFKQNESTMCIVTSIGAPAPLFNIPTFEAGNNMTGPTGFQSKNTALSSKGDNPDDLTFHSV
jgi:hypothetical protein